MPILASRDDLQNYCLRQLGAPVLQINVAEEQIDDAIDDAIQKFQEFHGDGSHIVMYEVPITAKDVENRFVTLPEEIFFIRSVYGASTAFSLNNLQHKAYLADIIDMQTMSGGGGSASRGGLVSYVIGQQHLSMIDNLFNSEKQFRFSRHSNRLYIETDWNRLGSFITQDDGTIISTTKLMLETFQPIEPEDYDSAYNNQWLKSYTTELLRKQWGWNLKKYQGFQLPSGIVLDGDSIYQEAKEKIEKLEQDLYEIWQLPVDFMMG